MSDHDLEPFEAELRQLRPRRAPESFTHRLEQALRAQASESTQSVPAPTAESPASVWHSWWKWLAPLASAAAIVCLILVLGRDPAPVTPETVQQASPPLIQEVELDQQLVAAFEGVAAFPDGLPVRFRCYGWQEALTLRDATGAIEVEQRGPRLEVVPVGFEVY